MVVRVSPEQARQRIPDTGAAYFPTGWEGGCLTWNGSKVYDTAIHKAATRNTLYGVIIHWQPVNYLFYSNV